MAQSVSASGEVGKSPRISALARHSLLVRVTHWIVTFAFFGLIVSGAAILIAHPRFYWGETGAVGAPSLFDLPLPFVIVGQTGWGRHLHFLCAWIVVLTGIVYLASGFLSRHFRADVLPHRRELSFATFLRAAKDDLHLARRPRRAVDADAALNSYNVLQRLAYSLVVFLLFPLAIWTGLAMSPAIDSVFPFAVTLFGGHQSARTIHFFIACALTLFLVVHVLMIALNSFTRRMRSMTIGSIGAPAAAARRSSAPPPASAAFERRA